ncbi:MAG TPA: ATP-binding protein [Methylibium sp.]|nr:ATP-binding protein [Methylibium sp.]
MTLQRRVLLLLLVSAPLVWLATGLFSLDRARYEINELFDTQLIRLARQVQSTLPRAAIDAIEPARRIEAASGPIGDAELEDMAIAVWDRQGHLLLVDREGSHIPYAPQSSGFHDIKLDDDPWRVYYLQAASGDWLIAVGQAAAEREELVWGLIAGQLLPWALTLPVLLAVMAAAVRQALRPLRALSDDIAARASEDLRPLGLADRPAELRPLVDAMNALFARVRDTIEHERRFTADAAHELRTPLAALQAQWDAARLAGRTGDEKIGEGLARLSRMVSQLLALARLDHAAHGPASPIDWRTVVGQAMDEVLPLADRQGVEIACEWPADGGPAMPLEGDPALLGALLRNLLENALRHAPRDSVVTLRFEAEALEVLDEGPGVAPEHLPRLGDRFFRPVGESTPGSGLGLSIVQRIAALHGLRLVLANRGSGPGFAARLERAPR